MTDRPCPLDGVPLAPDEYICRGCGGATRGRLRAVPDLLDELDTTLAGQRSNWSEPGGIHGRASGGCKPGCDHAPDNPSCAEGVALGMNLAASEAAMQLRVVLHGWARVWDEETPLAVDDGIVGPLCEIGGLCGHRTCSRILTARQAAPQRRNRDRMMSTAPRQAILLSGQHLAGRVWAPDLAAEIRDAVRAAERAIDRPPDQTLAGTCSCGMAVYAQPGDRTAHCRWCGTRHDPARLYDAMLEARGHLHAAPAAVIARILVDPTTGRPLCTAAQIRGWKHRGALDVDHVDHDGRPCYVITDVAKLAREGTPVAVGD